MGFPVREMRVLFVAWLVFGLPAGAAERPAPERPQALPASAQSDISSALGRDSAEYQLRVLPTGLEATITKQRIATRFTSQGVEVRCAGSPWNIAFLGYGHGEILHGASLVVPRAILNRVEYQRGTMTEWYEHGPAGLEQGFTLRKSPGGAGATPLTLRLSISGRVQATLSDDRSSLRLSDAGGHTHWLYTGLSAHDALGNKLPSWLELRGHLLLLRVNDAEAVYPVVVDPIVQLAKLTKLNGAAGDFWGYSIAMSGNTVVIGAPNSTVGSNTNQGAVYVFVKPPSGWSNMTQTAMLTASDGALSDSLGSSVAIKGNTVVAGAPNATVNKNLAEGAAYVFVEPSGGWSNMTQTAKLTASNGIVNTALGFSVAISGTTIAAGAPYQLGAVYVYNQPSGGWSGTLTQTAELTGSAAGVASLGNSVSFDANTIVAGAQQSIVNSNFSQGAVLVFVKPSGGWVNGTQTADLTASDGMTFDQLGAAVAISGTTIVAGAPNAAEGSNLFQGAAYVFVQPPGGWTYMTETAKLTASDGAAGDSFAFSVAIQAGAVVLCGAPGAAINFNDSQGAAYVFVKPRAGWETTSQFYAKVTASDGVAGTEAGTGLAISSNVGVLTAPGATVGLNVFQGAAYLFGQE